MEELQAALAKLDSIDQRISQVQNSFQQLQSGMQNNITSEIDSFKQELVAAEGIIQNGMQSFAQLQQWTLISSLCSNVLNLFILFSISYLICKKPGIKTKVSSVDNLHQFQDSPAANQDRTDSNILSGHSRSMLFFGKTQPSNPPVKIDTAKPKNAIQ